MNKCGSYLTRAYSRIPRASYCKCTRIIGVHPPKAMNGERPTATCKWTGWVWEITEWSSRLQEIYWSFFKINKIIYEIYLKLVKKYQTITTCNQLDLETLGFWPMMAKHLPGHSPRELAFARFLWKTLVRTLWSPSGQRWTFTYSSQLKTVTEEIFGHNNWLRS